jgi:hypothetical protein
VATHVKVVATLFLLFGGLLLALAFFTPLLMSTLAGIVGATHEEGAAIGATILGLTGIALSVIMLLFAIPYIVCGIGLFKFRRWARILGIILAAIALVRFPLGTAFGIYALIILFRKDTEALFIS